MVTLTLTPTWLNVTMVSNAVLLSPAPTFYRHSNNFCVKQLCGAGQLVNDSAKANGHGADSAFASDASRNQTTPMRMTLLKVAINLACRGFIGSFESKVVREMIYQENTVLSAAFKVRSSTTHSTA